MSDELMSYEDAMKPSTDSATADMISLSDASKIPVTAPSYAPASTASPYASPLPFYQESPVDDPATSPISQTQILKQAPPPTAEPSMGDELAYPVARTYSAVLEQPAWAVMQLGFKALAATYDFGSTVFDHDRLASGMRDRTSGWLNDAVDYYSKPEETAPATASANRVKQALSNQAYKTNFALGILGTTAEAATDLIAFMLPLSAAEKFTAGAKLVSEAPMLTEFAKSTAKLSGYAFVRTNGSITERGKSALAMAAYSMTPYIAQATGLTGLSVKAVNAALNVFASSPTYAAQLSAAGGVNREFATMFIPQFLFDVGFAAFLKGRPEAEIKARFKKMLQAPIKGVPPLTAAEAEVLAQKLTDALFAGEDIKVAVKTTEPAADNKAEIAKLKDERFKLMQREVALLSGQDVSAADSFSLPTTLSKSKPKYGYRGGLYDVAFGNDFDRAAYVIAADTKSKSHDAFLKAFADAGVSETVAKAHGKKVRAQIKALAAIQFNDGEMDGTLDLPTQPREGVQASAGNRSAELNQVRKQSQSLQYKIDKLEKGPKAVKEKPTPDVVIEAPAEPPTPATPVDRSAQFEKNRALKADGKKGALVKKLPQTMEEFVALVESGMTPMSSFLGRIHPKLGAALRSFEIGLNKSIMEDKAAIAPFQRGVKNMPEADRLDLAFALNNGWEAETTALLAKHDLLAEYAAWQKVRDRIGADARSVGFDFDLIEEYFPRVAKDARALLKVVRGDPLWEFFDEKIRQKEKELGMRAGSMEEDVQAAYINSLIKRAPENAIKLTTPSALKERGIETLTAALNQFYHDPQTAMTSYITSMNNMIAIRRFMGEGGTGAASLDNIKGSVGKLMLDLLARGELSGEDAKIVGDVLNDRLNEKGPGRAMSLLKTAAQIDVLANPVSAVTQIADVYASLYANGYFRTAWAIGRVLTGRNELGLNDAFLSDIAHEFSNSRQSSEFLASMLKKVGFQMTDAFGKKVFINAAYERLQAQAKNPNLKFAEDLRTIFGDEAEQVAIDLGNGVVSDNVKALLASEIFRFQPLALSEMPRAYATGGNYRAAYTLQSYTLKLLDVTRREVLDVAATNPVLAAQNFVKLTFALALMQAGTDEIKNFILMREPNFRDSVLSGLLQVVGFNRYRLGQLVREGPLSSNNPTILPPVRIVDSAFKDVKKDIQDGFNPVEWQSIRSIPVGGELFYWWLGGGRSKINEKRSKQFGANPAP
jgi:hypothetical protein